MSDNSKPVYDNPSLLQSWERDYIRTCLRFYTDNMRAFLKKNPAVIDECNLAIERCEARQEHIMEKLKQFQDWNEPEEDDEETEFVADKYDAAERSVANDK